MDIKKNPVVGQYCMVYGDNRKSLAVWNGCFIFFDDPIRDFEYWKEVIIEGPLYQWLKDGSMDVYPEKVTVGEQKYHIEQIVIGD